MSMKVEGIARSRCQDRRPITTPAYTSAKISTFTIVQTRLSCSSTATWLVAIWIFLLLIVTTTHWYPLKSQRPADKLTRGLNSHYVELSEELTVRRQHYPPWPVFTINMISESEIARLKAFHASHFPNQPIPDIRSTQQASYVEQPQADAETQAEYDDGLGYYEDGVKRTLTDEQIKMFRHSEIQRLLAERRTAREKDDSARQEVDDQAKTRHPFQSREWPSYDKPSKDQPIVDTLMYDEEPVTQPPNATPKKRFLWPTLGKPETTLLG
jgi:hypothetical protein